jgi:hypothetical protein
MPTSSPLLHQEMTLDEAQAYLSIDRITLLEFVLDGLLALFQIGPDSYITTRSAVALKARKENQHEL